MQAVQPNPIERQCVDLYMRVFCDRTAAALRLNNCHDTAAFVETVVNFWKITNVKGIRLHLRYNDKYRGVVEASNQWQVEFLRAFARFARHLCPPAGSGRVNTLTRDTATALHNTCLGLVALL